MSNSNQEFCESPTNKRPAIFKRNPSQTILDDTHIIGILNKEQVDWEIAERYYAPAPYSVKYLRKILKMLSILDEYEKEDSLYIWLPKEIVYPALIRVTGYSEKVYAIAPRAVDWYDNTKQ
jgi:hypothetical protein